MSNDTRRLDLTPTICHVPAPMWFLCAHGHRGFFGAPVCCPACGSATVRIRCAGGKLDSVLIQRGADALIVPTAAGGEIEPGSADPGSLSVSIPMVCDRGHAWLLDFDQNEEKGLTAAVMFDAEVYDELYPAEKERWS